MTVLHVKSPNGTTDEAMLLANNQTVTGIKTFNDRIAFYPNGQIGARSTNHDIEDPYNIRHLCLSANNIDYWDDGNSGFISLLRYDENNEHEDGSFTILATNNDNHRLFLQGHPDGSLNNTYNQRMDIPYIHFEHPLSYNECVRRGNGLQICWGYHQQTGNNGTVGEVTFQMPFIQEPRIVGAMNEDVEWNGTFLIRSLSTTQFTFLVTDYTGFCHNHWCHWLAIGRWR